MVWKTASHWAWVASVVAAGSVSAQPPAAPVPLSSYAVKAAPGAAAAAEPAAKSSTAGAPAAATDASNPAKVLDRPLQTPAASDFVPVPDGATVRFPMDPPLGFTGRTGVLPTETQGGSDFVPIEDRWRLGMPAWDRYGKGHPPVVDYPWDLGNICNPYKQNVLKGDYPIIGQHTFLILTATDLQLTDTRQTPIGTTPFESTSRPFREEFFGSPNQLAYIHLLRLQLELNHGDAAFKQDDWKVVVTPIFNVNTLNVSELAVVNPDVAKGTERRRTRFALEEYFLETKLADTSPYFDFVSVRGGSQFFNSDFKGFLFSDTNKAIRLFGTREANRDQFNIAFFRQSEKDTNSGLNTFEDRGQNVLIANYYRQDFIWPGLTVEASVHYDHDEPTFKFDRNNNLVRPDPVGTFKQHTIDAVYLGLAADGHIDRYNITSQLYYVLGHDTNNPLANQGQDIDAFMAAAELSYDRDWARFRASIFYASGDHEVNNHTAHGFDTIFDNPNFAGGQFSFWQRQQIKLFGVNLKQAGSLVADLRSSKTQGQANFVNPGVTLFNLGIDFDLTPKIKMINNCNFLWFNSTKPLETFVFDAGIDNRIGTDLSMGFEYRPLLSNNIIVVFGVSGLVPGSGFKSLYNQKVDNIDPLVAGFLELNLTY